MSKYRDKSDVEINKAVAVARGYKVMSCGESVMAYIDSGYKPFDPCNNPADAMPIIMDNKIDLTHLIGGVVCAKHKECWCVRKNPYRAGCEVYLLMKDAENE